MEITEVLHQISPCDTQKPYIFISYSSHDKELVWRDVLQYQSMGYNVWLDEKNLDKTKDSWKADALTAIEDMYCMLVVFYVSKFSLLSDACYRELSKTRDEFTTALHYGPVKFIAIDVDEIGNIVDFTRQLHQSVFQDVQHSKESKAQMLLTLHQFMKDFFDSNNEKVRVHPKNESNRKMNYYEEIVASFPDVTRNCPKVAVEDAADDSAADEKNSQVVQKLTEEAEVRKKVEAEASQLKEEMEKLVNARNSTPERNDTGADCGFTCEQISAAIARANTVNLSSTNRIMSVEECGETKILNAIKAYAGKIKPQEVIGLMDNTLFGSGKEGCIITKDRLYSDNFKGRSVEFAKIAGYEMGSKQYDVIILYKDGTKQRFFITTVRQKVILPFFDALLNP